MSLSSSINDVMFRVGMGGKGAKGKIHINVTMCDVKRSQLRYMSEHCLI